MGLLGSPHRASKRLARLLPAVGRLPKPYLISPNPQSFSKTDILQVLAIALLAGFFWLQAAQDDTLLGCAAGGRAGVG